MDDDPNLAGSVNTGSDEVIQAPGEILGVTSFVEAPRRVAVAEAAAAPAQADQPFSSLVPAIIGGSVCPAAKNARM